MDLGVFTAPLTGQSSGRFQNLKVKDKTTGLFVDVATGIAGAVAGNVSLPLALTDVEDAQGDDVQTLLNAKQDQLTASSLLNMMQAGSDITLTNVSGKLEVASTYAVTGNDIFGALQNGVGTTIGIDIQTGKFYINADVTTLQHESKMSKLSSELLINNVD